MAIGLALLTLASHSHAASKQCTWCGAPLNGRYYTYNGGTYCSQSCIDHMRPTCDICGSIIKGTYRTTDDGKFVCSDACFQKTLPRCEACQKTFTKGYTVNTHVYCENCIKNGHTCFSCNRPAAYYETLSDQRIICTDCKRWSVSTQKQALRHYDRARRQLEAWTGTPIQKIPKLQLVNLTEMKKQSKSLRKVDSTLSVRGLYSRQTWTLRNKTLAHLFKKEPPPPEETIYIIDHLHDEVFRVTAVHELMHHFIHENVPKFEKAPLWVQEGICQFAAADYCRRKVYTETLYAIEHSTDPEYGDGYRYIKRIVGYQGWNGLHAWMDACNVKKLPQTAPQ